MNYQVELYKEKYIIVALNSFEDDNLFVLKKIGKEEYIGIAQKTIHSKTFSNMYYNLRKFEYLFSNPKEKIMTAEFYNIDENYKFKVEYKLRDKWVVSIFNNEIKKVYDFKNKDFKEIEQSKFLINDPTKYQKRYIYKQKNKKN